MRHLVIGGSGFLGANVCARLLRDGEEPIAFGINPSYVLQWHMEDQISWLIDHSRAAQASSTLRA